MHVKRKYTQLGDSTSNGFVTFLIFPDNQNSFIYYNPKTLKETEVSYLKKDAELNLTFKGVKIPHILRIHSTKKPNKVLRGGKLIARETWNYDVSQKKIIIRTSLENWSSNYTIQF